MSVLGRALHTAVLYVVIFIILLFFIPLYFWVWTGYIYILLLLFFLYCFIEATPELLGYSKGYYSLIFMINLLYNILANIGFSIYYFSNSDLFHGINSYSDALYFSLTTWTTLGFGDITALSSGVKILSSLQSFVGVLSLTILGATIWMYCQLFMRESKIDSLCIGKTFDFSTYSELGALTEIPTEETKKEQEKRNKKFILTSCKKCNGNAYLNKIYFLSKIGVIPVFIAECSSCQNYADYSSFAYKAARNWQVQNNG